jgi:homoserine kinase
MKRNSDIAYASESRVCLPPMSVSQGRAAVRAVSVAVPATSANLGAGFDVFGLALRLYNSFSVSAAAAMSISISGAADNGRLPLTEDNLFYRSFAELFAHVGMSVPAVRIAMNIEIPAGRGLGSSATAVVGGLVAANRWLGEPYSREELLPLAIELEHGNHPDNVSPALLGGLVVCSGAKNSPLTMKVPFPADLKAVLLIPSFEMDTVGGRRLMPSQYPTGDVVFSTGHVALFLAALQSRNYTLLRTAMQDRLHQPYRSQLFPAMPDIIAAANDAGALGASLSGGGSTIIALANQRHDIIATAMCRAAAEHGVESYSSILSVATQGAKIVAERLTT